MRKGVAHGKGQGAQTGVSLGLGLPDACVHGHARKAADARRPQRCDIVRPPFCGAAAQSNLTCEGNPLPHGMKQGRTTAGRAPFSVAPIRRKACRRKFLSRSLWLVSWPLAPRKKSRLLRFRSSRPTPANTNNLVAGRGVSPAHTDPVAPAPGLTCTLLSPAGKTSSDLIWRMAQNRAAVYLREANKPNGRMDPCEFALHSASGRWALSLPAQHLPLRRSCLNRSMTNTVMSSRRDAARATRPSLRNIPAPCRFAKNCVAPARRQSQAMLPVNIPAFRSANPMRAAIPVIRTSSPRAVEARAEHARERICVAHALHSAPGRDNVRPLTKEGARC